MVLLEHYLEKREVSESSGSYEVRLDPSSFIPRGPSLFHAKRRNNLVTTASLVRSRINISFIEETSCYKSFHKKHKGTNNVHFMACLTRGIELLPTYCAVPACSSNAVFENLCRSCLPSLLCRGCPALVCFPTDRVCASR